MRGVDGRWVLRETGLVAVVGGFQVFTAHAGGERFGEVPQDLDALGIGLLVLGPLTLPLRRRAPWLVLGTAVLAGIVYFSLGYPGAAIFATVVVALVSLRRRRVAEEREVREQEQARRIGEERLAIARDLHDVLAHSLSVVQVQAGVALHLLDERPDHVRGALEAIKSASDDGMRELRAAVATLRREGPSYEPAPGLEELPRLLDGARASGLVVREHRTGERDVPPAVGLVAYRVVQEALTNVVRHAGATAVDVHVGLGARVVLAVEDDGRGGGAGRGDGLLGMQERVAALGGTLEAGPRPEGGWRVRAVLPA